MNTRDGSIDLHDGADPKSYPARVRTFFGPDFPGPAEGVAESERRGVLPGMTRLESAQIEITTVCNLKCQQCSRTIQTALGAWNSRHLELDKYVKIVSKLPPADRLILQGVGEPSLHPNFLELVRFAMATGKFNTVAFNTNGHSRNDQFWIDLARDYSCGVSLSIDSLDPVVAEVCRSGTNADFLFGRLQLMRKIFKRFSVTMVASKLNIEDLARTLEKIGKLGPGRVGIQDVITSHPGIAMDAADGVRLDEDIAVLRRAYPELKVIRANISSGLKKCVAPFLAPFITLEGYLTPCCAFIEPALYDWVSVLGDEDWDTLRTDRRVAGWMERFIVADPDHCQACTFNPAIKDLQQTELKRFREGEGRTTSDGTAIA